MLIEFNDSADLLKEGIIPFPVKKIKIDVDDSEKLEVIMSFYENLIRDYWCKGRLRTKASTTAPEPSDETVEAPSDETME